MWPFTNIGRYAASQSGGKAAKERYDKTGDLTAELKKVANQKLVEKYKPQALQIVNREFDKISASVPGTYGDDLEERLIELLEGSIKVPAVAALPIQLAIGILFDKLDVDEYLTRGLLGIEELRTKVTRAILGARL